jgi:NADH:ubiquinone oxidoreductase subunit D
MKITKIFTMLSDTHHFTKLDRPFTLNFVHNTRNGVLRLILSMLGEQVTRTDTAQWAVTSN